MRYDDFVKSVCGDNWSQTKNDEKDGGYGVAIVKAYLSGVDADRNGLVKHLDVPWHHIEFAFKRLQTNGIFSGRSWVKGDSRLNSDALDAESQKMWSFVAALASGFLGKGLPRSQDNTQ